MDPDPKHGLKITGTYFGCLFISRWDKLVCVAGLGESMADHATPTLDAGMQMLQSLEASGDLHTPLSADSEVAPQSVFRIRISLHADPDPDSGFYLNADPDSGFRILDPKN
jgi:hypothetical protein